jgi:hypothetical protein
MISPEASVQAQSLNALLIAADMTGGTVPPATIPGITDTTANTTATATVEAVPELYAQQQQQQVQQQLLQQQEQQTVAAVIGGSVTDSSSSIVNGDAPAQLTWGTVIANSSASSVASNINGTIDNSAGQATAQGK